MFDMEHPCGKKIQVYSIKVIWTTNSPVQEGRKSYKGKVHLYDNKLTKSSRKQLTGFYFLYIWYEASLEEGD